MKEAAQCRQFDELRTGDGMVGQVFFAKIQQLALSYELALQKGTHIGPVTNFQCHQH